MRDSDRLKEKLDVSLDNRQIFYLFFGSSVVVCLVFVVGVLVGKRLEKRKLRHHPPAAADELAMVDRDTRLAAKGLTFHDELIKPDARFVKNAPPEVAEWRDMGQGGQVESGQPGSAGVVAVGRGSSARGGQGADSLSPSAATGRLGRRSGGSRRSRAARVPRRGYTLQVSAFQSKMEADQMIKKLQKSGYRPYVVASKLPRRGVWYRVRLGTFQSWGQAMAAKRKFEEKINMTAYVSRR